MWVKVRYISAGSTKPHNHLYTLVSKSSLRLEFAGQFPDTLHEAGLGDREGDVQDGLRHQAAVLAVHQPHKAAGVGAGARLHLHSTAMEWVQPASTRKYYELDEASHKFSQN